MDYHPLAAQTLARTHTTLRLGGEFVQEEEKIFSSTILSSTRYALGFSAYNRFVP